MAKVITDLAKLNKAMLTPVEKPKSAEAPIVADDGREAMEYFASQDEEEESVSEAQVYKTALEELAEEKADIELRLEHAERGLSAARGRISELERQVERLTGDNARLRGEAAKREETKNAAAEVAVRVPAVEVSRKGLLDRPFAFEEMFDGEVREMLLASLAEYRKNVENGGYQRRAAVLDAVLSANQSSGELEARSEKLRQILKDAGYFNDPKPLEKLGIKLIDGRKHWKLEYAGIRITLAKTPSDHCSNANSAADISRRCF